MFDILLGISWKDLLSSLFLKILTASIFLPITLLFRPVRTRALKWLKKVTGRTKYSVIVTGRIYPQYTPMEKRGGFPFEVELPYKDISEDSMPIRESDNLIYSAVNQKYGEDFYSNGYSMNHVSVRKVES